MRRRILLLVIGMTTLVVLAFAIPVGVLLRSAIAQRAEHATTDQANSVALYLGSGHPSAAQIVSYLKSVSINTGRPSWVMLPDCRIAGTPPASLQNTPDASPGRCFGGRPIGDGGPGGFQQADLHTVAGGQVAEVATRAGDALYLVRVFLSSSARYSGEAKWWTLLIFGSLGLLLIGIVAGELLTRRIVRPLDRTARTANELSAGDSTARAPTDGPREIAEVGTALNRLADRIDQLIAEERETVADFSHRLRTPLTTLRLDAEALRDPIEAERVGNHVTVLERMLTAVIRAARRPQREGRLPSCDASAVIDERVRFWSALTDEQNRQSSVERPEQPVPVRASAEDLGAAVDALLENVVAHTADGTAFTVRLTPTNDGACLQIADDGPGVPVDAVLRGRSDRGSSGLGLDIARRCAEGSGGSMRIARSETGGALITLVLGAP
ncbi:MAG: HAMP domain-containing histidine kinase [Actinomycetota bacterium]|nr:HAMP domain-containing histidine kinase [Actinomycetota bacterium]